MDIIKREILARNVTQLVNLVVGLIRINVFYVLIASSSMMIRPVVIAQVKNILFIKLSFVKSATRLAILVMDKMIMSALNVMEISNLMIN